MTVNSIIQYIEENLESKFINIDCLVLYSGFSRRYLQISFKEYVGMPIGTYIRVRRASRAAALLRLTRLTIIEISAKLFMIRNRHSPENLRKYLVIPHGSIG